MQTEAREALPQRFADFSRIFHAGTTDNRIICVSEETDLAFKVGLYYIADPLIDHMVSIYVRLVAHSVISEISVIVNPPDG